jgi:hypothetical protein
LYGADTCDACIRRVAWRWSSSKALSNDELCSVSVVTMPPFAIYWADEWDCDRLRSGVKELSR